ncbi:hypothetical protein TNCV_1026901 [Trichonephila clavipes]|nr:hypothetical protein TNCV_1026901 [Trichonephila clavipes]
MPSAQDCYLRLNVQLHSQTMAPQLARNPTAVPGRITGTDIGNEFYEGMDICRIDSSLRSPYHNSIQYVCDCLEKAIFQRSSPPRTPQVKNPT